MGETWERLKAEETVSIWINELRRTGGLSLTGELSGYEELVCVVENAIVEAVSRGRDMGVPNE